MHQRARAYEFISHCYADIFESMYRAPLLPKTIIFVDCLSARSSLSHPRPSSDDFVWGATCAERLTVAAPDVARALRGVAEDVSRDRLRVSLNGDGGGITGIKGMSSQATACISFTCVVQSISSSGSG